MATRKNETVPGVPGLYAREGKRKTSYSARLASTICAAIRALGGRP